MEVVFAGVMSMDELVIAVVLSQPFFFFSSFFFFSCTARRALVYTRGSCLISISLLLLSLLLFPNLDWVCRIISLSAMQKNGFTVFNVKVTVRTYIIKI